MNKRQLLTGALGVGLGAMAAKVASAQTGSMIPRPAQEVKQRIGRGTVLFKVDGYANAMDTTPEGIWVGEQTEFGITKGGPREKSWLMDPTTGKVLRTVSTDSFNTSGMGVGGGYVWMIANGGPNGIYKTDMNSKTVAHYPLPLGDGGCHGAFYRDGKLWVMHNRLKVIMRLDAATMTPEFAIPFNSQRYHDICWDNGFIWMVTGTTGFIDSNKPGLNKYDAATGRLVEQVSFPVNDPDPHGLTIHNGVMYSCDAGIAPGFVASGSKSAKTVFRIDLT
jgi:streptogramin lyase